VLSTWRNSVCTLYIQLCFIDTSSAAFPVVDPDVPRLTHLSKARPKNPKQHSAKRLAVDSECLLIENAASRNEGLDLFFSTGKQPRGSVKQKKPVASPRRFYFCYTLVPVRLFGHEHLKCS